MPGTFTKIYIHAVFAVKGRENIIKKTWSDELYKYISGIITRLGQKSIIVHGAPDHVHCLFGQKPNISISDIIRDVKSNSTQFINEKKFVAGKFAWQEGYGAFSHSHSQLNDVYRYIENQEDHHKRKTFREEYVEMLTRYEVDFDEKYLFDFFNA